LGDVSALNDAQFPRMERPLGVTVISILSGAGAALSFLAGLAFLASSQQLTQLAMQLDPTFATYGSDVFALAIQILAAFFMAVGLVVGVDAYGLWKGKGWAWWLSMILGALVMLSSLLAFPYGLVSTAVELAIILYLVKPSVRTYFKPQAEALPATTIKR
jgi:hypothetical protein